MAQKRNRLPDGRRINSIAREEQPIKCPQSWVGLIVVALLIAGFVIYGLAHS